MDNVFPGSQWQLIRIQGNDQSRESLCKVPCRDMRAWRSSGSCVALCIMEHVRSPCDSFKHSALCQWHVHVYPFSMGLQQSNQDCSCSSRAHVALQGLCSALLRPLTYPWVCVISLHDVIRLEMRLECFGACSLIIWADHALLPVRAVWDACQLSCHLPMQNNPLRKATSLVDFVVF